MGSARERESTAECRSLKTTNNTVWKAIAIEAECWHEQTGVRRRGARNVIWHAMLFGNSWPANCTGGGRCPVCPVTQWMSDVSGTMASAFESVVSAVHKHYPA